MVIDCPAVAPGFGTARTSDDVDNRSTSANGNDGSIMDQLEGEKKTIS